MNKSIQECKNLKATYEYMIAQADCDNEEHILDWLNHLGSMGWCVVQAISISKARFYFSRMKNVSSTIESTEIL